MTDSDFDSDSLRNSESHQKLLLPFPSEVFQEILLFLDLGCIAGIRSVSRVANDLSTERSFVSRLLQRDMPEYLEPMEEYCALQSSSLFPVPDVGWLVLYRMWCQEATVYCLMYPCENHKCYNLARRVWATLLTPENRVEMIESRVFHRAPQRSRKKIRFVYESESVAEWDYSKVDLSVFSVWGFSEEQTGIVHSFCRLANHVSRVRGPDENQNLLGSVSMSSESTEVRNFEIAVVCVLHGTLTNSRYETLSEAAEGLRLHPIVAEISDIVRPYWISNDDAMTKLSGAHGNAILDELARCVAAQRVRRVVLELQSLRLGNGATEASKKKPRCLMQ